MPEMIPNWHPVWVHFAIALLITAALANLLALLGGRRDDGPSQALVVARWTLWMGVVAAGLALLTGYWAAGSVAHDDAGHANMLMHRNWAIGGASLFALAAVLELFRRGPRGASLLSVALTLIGAVAIGVTGYKGGENVYEHGLGVERLPETGGHDHAAHGHGDGAHAGDGLEVPKEVGQAADGRNGHDHSAHEHPDGDDASEGAGAGGHDHSSHVHSDTPAESVETTGSEAAAHDHSNHDHGDGGSSATTGAIDTGEAAAVADRLYAALAEGDVATVSAVLDPQVLIFESGGVEASFEEYSGHHMPSDMAFLKAMERELLSRKVFRLGDDTAVVSSRSRLKGEFRDQEVDITSTETLTLERRDGNWRIIHIHWSSGS